MDNLFKRINEDIFRSVKGITWYDQTGVMNLDDDRFVQFTLDDIGTRDHFNGYMVEVFNKTSGCIYKKFFRFQHHMEFNHRSERDKYYHIWYNSGNLDWYISRPKDTKKFVKILMDFVNQIK